MTKNTSYLMSHFTFLFTQDLSMTSFFQSELERIYRELPVRTEQFIHVRQAKKVMETRYSDKIKIDELAEAAHMSRFHFIRLFRRIYGLTPRHFLRDIRIEKAKQRLRGGDAITQVCFAVGYDSLPTFSSVFKKCTGQSPKSYQQNNRAI